MVQLCRLVLIRDAELLPAQGGAVRRVIRPNGRSLGWRAGAVPRGCGPVWRGTGLGKEVRAGAL